MLVCWHHTHPPNSKHPFIRVDEFLQEQKKKNGSHHHHHHRHDQ